MSHEGIGQNFRDCTNDNALALMPSEQTVYFMSINASENSLNQLVNQLTLSFENLGVNAQNLELLQIFRK